MKRPLLALALLALSGTVSYAVAQPQTMPITADADAEQIDTKILAVDAPNRLVTIETPSGPTVIHVSDKVKNLAQVKAGDTLRITYNLAVATAIKRGGTPIRSNVQAQSGGQVALLVVHAEASVSSEYVAASARSRSSASRARPFTVPSGSPRRSAISLWDRPSK